MDIGDRVQTINTFCPISGTVVEVYDSLIVISDDDAETDDDRLEFHISDLETVQKLAHSGLHFGVIPFILITYTKHPYYENKN